MVHERLLETAVREFGAKGLEGASTRGIAAAAQTAMSSITYHYGGKEGLYIAAADYIAAQMADVTAGVCWAPDTLPQTAAEARAAIHEVLARMVDKMAAEQSVSWSLFVTREQMNPTAAFEHIYAGPMGRMVESLVEMVGIATGNRDPLVAKLTVITLMGQVLAIRSSRATCAKLLERDVSDPTLIADLTARIAANTDAILDRLISERRDMQ